jgi:hypothetical protein
MASATKVAALASKIPVLGSWKLRGIVPICNPKSQIALIACSL